MANIARAKAKKATKDALLKQQLALGQAALEAGLESAADLKAVETMVRLLEVWFGPEGALTFEKGSIAHFAALSGMRGSRQVDLKPLEDWWKAKGWPMAMPAQAPSNAATGSKSATADTGPPAKP